MVVTAKASEAEVRGTDSSSRDELQTRPRGFFADQFEASKLRFTKEKKRFRLTSN